MAFGIHLLTVLGSDTLKIFIESLLCGYFVFILMGAGLRKQVNL